MNWKCWNLSETGLKNLPFRSNDFGRPNAAPKWKKAVSRGLVNMLIYNVFPRRNVIDDWLAERFFEGEHETGTNDEDCQTAIILS